MNFLSPNPNIDKHKYLRTQQLALLGLAALALIITWLDGLSGLIHATQNIHAGQGVVMVRTRWYITGSLPLISIVALAMASIAYYRQQLFDTKTMVLSGAVTVSAVIALSVGVMIGFDNWTETQSYERCTALDSVKGITRYGVRNVEFSAWTPIGQCR